MNLTLPAEGIVTPGYWGTNTPTPIPRPISPVYDADLTEWLKSQFSEVYEVSGSHSMVFPKMGSIVAAGPPPTTFETRQTEIRVKSWCCCHRSYEQARLRFMRETHEEIRKSNCEEGILILRGGVLHSQDPGLNADETCHIVKAWFGMCPKDVWGPVC